MAKAAGGAILGKCESGKKPVGGGVLSGQPDYWVKGILPVGLCCGEFGSRFGGGMEQGTEKGAAGNCLRFLFGFLDMDKPDWCFAIRLQGLIAGSDFLIEPSGYGRITVCAAAGVDGKCLFFGQCPEQAAVDGPQTGHTRVGDFAAHEHLWGEVLGKRQGSIIVIVAVNRTSGTDGGAQPAVIAFFLGNVMACYGLFRTDCLTAVAGDMGVVE